MGVIGVLAILLALVLFIDPIGVIRSFLWIVGLYALIMGVILVVRSLSSKSMATSAEHPVEPDY